MELGAINLQTLWFVLGTAVFIFVFLYFIVGRQRSEQSNQVTLPYDEAKSMAYEMLRKRYAGHRGYYISYQKEFDFALSMGTLKKALQPTNPTPNTRYVQQVLDDLAPGKYKVLPPPSQTDNQVA